MTLKEEPLFSWPLLYIFVFYIGFLFSKDKKKPHTVLVPTFCALFVVLFVWSTNHSNKELRALKDTFSQGEYETIIGKVTFESFVKHKGDGIDRFTIGSRKIIRDNPTKKYFKKGCWTGSVMKQGQLLNGVVKIDYIAFDNSVSSTKRATNKKFDQLCILKIERIGNNPELRT
ncbi:hypothetical protein [Thalassotalea atypica]|uniref:hypothetical protein n=1 Tax=Thalassotalea atypica TaxID=2054316 RepID=UPI002573C7F7|nr:hypothetical protein [Thalassotalea atypica]